MKKETLDRLIEAHYPQYCQSIQRLAGITLDQAHEVFHTIYMQYVTPDHVDNWKYQGVMIRLFDDYVHKCCKALVQQRVNKENKDREREVRDED